MAAPRLSKRSGVVPDLHTATVAGAAAGTSITVTGIDPNQSTLLAVQNIAAAGVNLASQFTVAANAISNAGGTSTAGMTLLVMWANSARTPRG